MIDYDVIFIGYTTYDLLGVLKQDVNHLRTNQLVTWEYSFGGKAANAAVYCADAGARVTYIGVVGSDFERIGFGDYLRSASVAIDRVFNSNQKTPAYSAFTYEDKTYAFLQPLQYSDTLCVELRDHFSQCLEALSAKIVYCAINEHHLVLEAFRRARALGLLTAWNPLFSNLNADLERAILQETDYLFVNEKEAATLENQLGIEVHKYFEAFGISVICNTQGSRGCRLFDRGKIEQIPAVKIEPIIDPTGAGDAFAGTFLATSILPTFNSFKECAERATYVASSVVSKLGTQKK